MNGLIAQISQPSEGLDAGLYMPLYLVAILYVILFVAGRVLDGREDERADTVQDAAFALLLLAGVYVAALLAMAVFSEFDLIADLLQIMAIVIAFFVLLVVALLGLELALGLTSRTRKREHAAPPPGDS